MTVVDLYCPECRVMHAAEIVTRDAEGWPATVKWVTPHAQAERDQLGAEAGAAFAIGVDAGDPVTVAEALEAALKVNDP